MQRTRLFLTAAALIAGAITAACQGPPGLPGVSAYEVVVTESPLSSTASKQVNAACPSGKKALGAGWAVLDSTSAILDGTASYFGMCCGTGGSRN